MLKFIVVLFVSILSVACGTHFDIARERKSMDSVYIITTYTESTEKFTLFFNSTVVLQKEHEDGSSLYFLFDYKDALNNYKCFVMNNNSADCNQFIFFNKQTAMFYVTEECFSAFYPEGKSVDFKKMQIKLKKAEGDLNPWIVGKIKEIKKQKQ